MELIPVNLKLFYLINSHHYPVLDGFFRIYRFAGHGLFLLPVLALVYRFRRLKMRRLVIGLIISLSIAQIVKNTFPQYRPVLTLGADNVHLLLNLHGNSFPSADAAMAFTIMAALISGERKWIKGALVVYAVLVAYTRIYLGVHFPLDVTAGAVLGILAVNLSIFCPKRKSKSTESMELQHHDSEKVPVNVE